MNITVTTQAELDALPNSFKEYTHIQITGGTLYTPIIVRKARESSHVEAWGSSHVEAWGSSHVVARESSHVEARGSSHVEAWGSSHVVARESSHVVAWESSHVEARESSHVVAWESSHVEARGSSHVEARGSVSVHAQSESSLVELFGFAVCIAIAKCKLKLHSKTATHVKPKSSKGTKGWFEREGLKVVKGAVTVFKRVSVDFKTQEGTERETLYGLGSAVEHPSWSPTRSECGEGKLHACSRPYFCDEFRTTVGDRYIAISVAVKDLHAWNGGSYPHKIAFRKGTVLFECDKFGNKK